MTEETETTRTYANVTRYFNTEMETTKFGDYVFNIFDDMVGISNVVKDEWVCNLYLSGECIFDWKYENKSIPDDVKEYAMFLLELRNL